MTNVASTSNSSFTVNVNEANPNPSHVIGPNFVTVKLSGKSQYNLWRIQMECLLKSQHKVEFIKGAKNGKGKGKVGDIDAWIASDSLVKGWILGSLSEEVARKAVNHLTHMQKKTDFEAKDLWDELQRSYETKSPTRQAESVIEVISESEDAKSKDEPTDQEKIMETLITLVEDFKGEQFWRRRLYEYILQGNTRDVLDLLEKRSLNPWEKLTNNGNTVLHVAVGSSTENHELLKTLLEMTPTENTLIDVVNSDGSTLLHVAAIGSNTKVVDMLVERNPELLLAKDKEGHIPLALSISNMHTKTSECLYKHMKVHRNLLEQKEKEYDALLSGEPIMTCKSQLEQKYDALLDGEDIKTSMCLLEQKEKEYDALFTGKSGEDLVILAISCQDFCLAREIIIYYHVILDESDAVLTALAQNFPRELNFWERRDFRTELFIGIDFNRYTRRFQRAYEYNNACWIVLSSMLSLFLVYIVIGR